MEGVREEEINGERGAPAWRGWREGGEEEGMERMQGRKKGVHAACSLLNRVRGEMGLSVRRYSAS